MRCTSLWRTTSRWSKVTNEMSGISPSTSGTRASPTGGRAAGSIWVISPVTTMSEPKPRRVRNILICSGVVFWASSKMMKESFSVRPRM